MKLMRFFYQCSNSKIADLLQQSGGPTIQWIPFSQGFTDYDTLDAVIIVEPYRYQGQLLILHNAWQNFLVNQHPSIPLLIVGLSRYVHPNYLSLLDLNPSFHWQSLVNQARSSNQSFEELPLEGEDILSKLKPFFKGHSSESFIGEFSKVRQSFNLADIKYRGEPILDLPAESFSAIWPEHLLPSRASIRLCLNRWLNYKPYLALLPFFKDIAEDDIVSLLEELNQLTSGPEILSSEELLEKEEAYQVIDGYERIAKLIRRLKRIQSHYIEPEQLPAILLLGRGDEISNAMREYLPGFQFRISNDIERAGLEQLIKAHAPDLTLFNLEWLDRSGENPKEFCEWWQNRYPTIPLLVMLNFSTRADEQKWLGYGVAAILDMKKFEYREWFSLFVRLIAQRPTGKENTIEKIGKQTRKILIIEDEKDWYLRISQLTTKYHFVQASTLEESVAKLKADAFDLVFLDLFFQEEGGWSESGLDLLPFIKMHFPDIPIIVSSFCADSALVAKVLNLNADYFLHKEEFNPDIWLKTIENLIAYKEISEEALSLRKNISGQKQWLGNE